MPLRMSDPSAVHASEDDTYRQGCQCLTQQPLDQSGSRRCFVSLAHRHSPQPVTPVTVLDVPVPPSELIQLAGDLHVLFTVDMKLLHLAISSPVCGLQFGSGLAPAQRGTGQRLTTQAKSAAKDMDPALLLWEGCAAIRKCRR